MLGWNRMRGAKSHIKVTCSCCGVKSKWNHLCFVLSHTDRRSGHDRESAFTVQCAASICVLRLCLVVVQYFIFCFREPNLVDASLNLGREKLYSKAFISVLYERSIFHSYLSAQRVGSIASESWCTVCILFLYWWILFRNHKIISNNRVLESRLVDSIRNLIFVVHEKESN